MFSSDHASRDDDGGTDSGSAYVYELDLGTPIYPDFEDDNVIDGRDLLRIFSAFGEQGSLCDLNSNGTVDCEDMFLFGTYWKQIESTTPW